jgi:hypothetical protein
MSCAEQSRGVYEGFKKEIFIEFATLRSGRPNGNEVASVSWPNSRRTVFANAATRSEAEILSPQYHSVFRYVNYLHLHQDRHQCRSRRRYSFVEHPHKQIPPRVIVCLSQVQSDFANGAFFAPPSCERFNQMTFRRGKVDTVPRLTPNWSP